MSYIRVRLDQSFLLSEPGKGIARRGRPGMTYQSSADEEVVAMSIMKCTSVFALALLLPLAGDLPKAQAQQYVIVNCASGKCLDDPAFSHDPGTLIQQWTYNGGANQVWNIVEVSYGIYYIQNAASGLVLDVPNFATGDEVKIPQWPFNGGANQLWYFFYDDATETYTIANLNSDKVLDIYNFSLNDGTVLQQFTFNGGDNQRWFIYWY
jgi:hypothetical protein